MSASKRAPLVMFFAVMLASLGCDQLTKDFALKQLSGAGSSIFLLGSQSLGLVATVELILAKNIGGFLCLGDSMSSSARTVLFVIGSPLLLAALCTALLKQSRVARWDVTCAALLAGGGAGNWLDRLLRDGAVTDFVRLSAGPVSTGIFNLADVAIMAGACGLLLAHWRNVEPSASAWEEAETDDPSRSS